MVRLRHEDLGVVIDVPQDLADSLYGYTPADETVEDDDPDNFDGSDDDPSEVDESAPTDRDETPTDPDEAEVTPKPRGRGRAKSVEK